MGDTGSLLELDDGAPFIESEWIGQRKKYTDVPAFVRWEKEKAMEIPLDFLQSTKLPEPTLSVNEFLACELPRISSEIISSKVAKWFSKEPPSVLDIRTLLKRSIPSPAFLNQLEDASGQAWLDGAKSVIDWRINDGADYLPLWIVTFWRKAERVNGIQSIWKQSMKWLSYILELSPEDLNRFRALQKADKQLQVALKLSQKRGGNSDGED